jgi:hypothetical protein
VNLYVRIILKIKPQTLTLRAFFSTEPSSGQAAVRRACPREGSSRSSIERLHVIPFLNFQHFALRFTLCGNPSPSYKHPTNLPPPPLWTIPSIRSRATNYNSSQLHDFRFHPYFHQLLPLGIIHRVLHSFKSNK